MKAFDKPGIARACNKHVSLRKTETSCLNRRAILGGMLSLTSLEIVPEFCIGCSAMLQFTDEAAVLQPRQFPSKPGTGQIIEIRVRFATEVERLVTDN